MHVGYGCPFVGERLANSGLRRKYGINVVTIQRGMNLKVVPSGDNRLFPGDTIGVIGTDDQIAEILPVIEAEAPTPAVQPELTDFKLTSVVLSKKSPLIGQTLAGADVRRNYQTHVVTLERDGEFFDHAPRPAAKGRRQAMDSRHAPKQPRNSVSPDSLQPETEAHLDKTLRSETEFTEKHGRPGNANLCPYRGELVCKIGLVVGIIVARHHM